MSEPDSDLNFTSCTPSETQTLQIGKILDGDSFYLNDGREVRLIGVDCPEYKDQERNKRNAKTLGIDSVRYASYALKAKNFLSQLTQGKEVRTEIDPINAITGHHDKYQRFLAYVYVDDMMINAALINEGYCVTYRYFDFRHKEQFIQYEQNAKDNQKGMWQ